MTTQRRTRVIGRVCAGVWGSKSGSRLLLAALVLFWSRPAVQISLCVPRREKTSARLPCFISFSLYSLSFLFIVNTVKWHHYYLITVRAGIWKPQVTPLAQPVQVSSGETLLTKTSLALRHEVFFFFNFILNYFFGNNFVLQFSKENLRIGSGHNSKAAPFSPSSKYTEESIAETLTSQAEVLAKGVIGYVCLAVAFVQKWLIKHCLTAGWILRRMKKFTIRVRVKCSKCYRKWTRNLKRNPNLVKWNHQASTCQRWFMSRRKLFQPLLQSLKLPALKTVMKLQLMAVTLFKFVNDLSFFNDLKISLERHRWWHHPHRRQQSLRNLPVCDPLLRQLPIRILKGPNLRKPLQTVRAAVNAIDSLCNLNLIVKLCNFTSRVSVFRGVFVRLKEKNLHVECFKCSTCGTSLKNVGQCHQNRLRHTFIAWFIPIVSW